MSVMLAGRVLAFAVAVVGWVLPISTFAAVGCQDLVYGSATYGEKMGELAVQAKLPNSAWSRYHESIVAGLCGAKPKDVDDLVDGGSVPAGEAERIAAVLGKTYRRKQPSDIRKKYASSKTEFIEMGACSACADHMAQYYSKKPSSRCAKLAKRALDGDSLAIEELVGYPTYCRWAYRDERR
jgi:hypothetical protein